MNSSKKKTYHRLCLSLPRMDDDEFQRLVEDVKANGVRQPIITLNGEIVDGRHRHMAAELAGVECPSIEYDPDQHGDLLDLIVSANLNRRHMSASQRGMAAAALAKQRAGTANGALNAPPVGTKKAAEVAGVSERTVQQAVRVAKADPKLAKKVAEGSVSLAKAEAKVAEKSKQAERAPVAKATGGTGLFDRLGVPVPVSLGPVFDSTAHKDVMNQFRAIRKTIEELMQSNVGVYVRPGALTDLASAATEIKGAAPFAVCPYCQGRSTASCKPCGGNGWLNEQRWNATPEEIRLSVVEAAG